MGRVSLVCWAGCAWNLHKGSTDKVYSDINRRRNAPNQFLIPNKDNKYFNVHCSLGNTQNNG